MDKETIDSFGPHPVNPMVVGRSMNQTAYYKFFGQRPPQPAKESIKEHKHSEAGRREKLVRTIESYELRDDLDEQDIVKSDVHAKNVKNMPNIEKEKERTILLLGSAIRR